MCLIYKELLVVFSRSKTNFYYVVGSRKVMLSVSALSSYVFCPNQFYQVYVLKEKVKDNKAMLLGSIKHKIFDFLSQHEFSLISSIKSDTDLSYHFQSFLKSAARKSIITYRKKILSFGLSPVDVFRSCSSLIAFETSSIVSRVKPHFDKGLSGMALFDAISPKIKPEYSIKSINLGLKGRIDQLACFGDRLVPIELKSGTPPIEGVWDYHKIQAVSYALLLSDVFKTDVNSCVIHYVDHDRKHEIVVDSAVRDWVLSIRDSCLALFDEKQPPKGCGKCDFCSRPS